MLLTQTYEHLSLLSSLKDGKQYHMGLPHNIHVPNRVCFTSIPTSVKRIYEISNVRMSLHTTPTS